MSEMVERVARGIFESECAENRREYIIGSDKFVEVDWDGYTWKDIYRSRARAAIMAMREPTLAMIDAGFPHAAGDCATPDDFADAFRYAVDAALKEKPE